MARANEGFDDVFNMDYDKADRVFASLEKDYPQHPQPPLYAQAFCGSRKCFAGRISIWAASSLRLIFQRRRIK